MVNEPGNCGEIIAVVYELTKRLRRKYAFFVPNQEPAFA